MTNTTYLERKSNLVMPSHYVELDREEMIYVEGGGVSWWQKILIVAACVLIGIALCLLVAYGLATAAAVFLFKTTFAAFVASCGAGAVATVIASCIGAGATIGTYIADILIGD